MNGQPALIPPSPIPSKVLIDLQLHIYDIRYPPNNLHPAPNPSHKHHKSTSPYLSFPEYSPSIVPDFDLCPDLGLLASASEERVQLFSLASGKHVDCPLSRYRSVEPIESLCFEGGGLRGSSDSTPGLLVCGGDRVDEWVW